MQQHGFNLGEPTISTSSTPRPELNTLAITTLLSPPLDTAPEFSQPNHSKCSQTAQGTSCSQGLLGKRGSGRDGQIHLRAGRRDANSGDGHDGLLGDVRRTADAHARSVAGQLGGDGRVGT